MYYSSTIAVCELGLGMSLEKTYNKSATIYITLAAGNQLELRRLFQLVSLGLFRWLGLFLLLSLFLLSSPL